MPTPRALATVAAAAVGAFVGIGGVTLDYAEGTSYLSADPRACVSCHIMRPQYDSWQKASHHGAATCVDCHLPHAFVARYLAKARNGWNHSKAFTLQDFSEPIAITSPNAEILHDNCLRCHAAVTDALGLGRPAAGAPRCVTCHAAVGHGERTGLGGPLDHGEIRMRGGL